MSKLFEKLRAENQGLKQQLNSLLQNARDNEEKLKRFEYIEFKLMQANSIHEVFEIILLEYPGLFKLSFSTLVLADCELNISPLIEQNINSKKYLNKLKLLHLPKQLDTLEYFSKAIYLGPYIEHRYAWLIENDNFQPFSTRSIAVIPLIRQDRTIGIFSCASDSSRRFEPGFGNDFMKRLGFVLSVCIENAINSEKLKQHSLTDPLTKVRNRRFFEQSLLEEITRVKRSNLSLSCVLLDIDHFKKVNDEYGHRAGDQVLIQVVKRISLTLRAHEVLVRYGGEEFALLLPETDNSNAIMVANRILNSVNEKAIPYDENCSLPITISAGVSTYTVDSATKSYATNTAEKKLCEDLVHKADLALYKAKHSGRNRVCNSGVL